MSLAASVRKALVREVWEARALELAEAKHMIGAPPYLHEREDGHVWRVPSQSRMGSYEVLARENGHIECPCQAGVWDWPCSHAGAVLYAERQRQEAQRETSRSPDPWWECWMRDGEYDR